MCNNKDELWNLCLEQCKDILGDSVCKAWIKPIEPLDMSDTRFVVSVRSEIQRKILDDKYRVVLEDLLSSLCGKQLKFDIVVNTTKSPDKHHPIASDEKEADAVADDNTSKVRTSLKIENGVLERYIFENFVVGNSNRIAYAAAKRVAEQPATSYNPLFIYGASGLGKTHLMHAIGNYIQKHDQERKVLYITSETFMNEIVDAIAKKKTDVFRNKYRGIDCLLIDDIQFLKGKVQTQVEFFHTFNSLYEQNKQMVICSDRPPKEIETLEERLCSRFSGGMQANIQSPDLESRMAILRQKAVTDNIAMPSEVAAIIAASQISNVRELEGLYTKLVVYAEITGEAITIDLAKKLLKEMKVSSSAQVITIENIAEIVEKTFCLKAGELIGKERKEIKI